MSKQAELKQLGFGSLLWHLVSVPNPKEFDTGTRPVHGHVPSVPGACHCFQCSPGRSGASRMFRQKREVDVSLKKKPLDSLQTTRQPHAGIGCGMSMATVSSWYVPKLSHVLGGVQTCRWSIGGVFGRQCPEPTCLCGCSIDEPHGYVFISSFGSPKASKPFPWVMKDTVNRGSSHFQSPPGKTGGGGGGGGILLCSVYESAIKYRIGATWRVVWVRPNPILPQRTSALFAPMVSAGLDPDTAWRVSMLLGSALASCLRLAGRIAAGCKAFASRGFPFVRVFP